MRQLKELFIKIDRGEITGEMVQELIEKSGENLPYLFKKVLEKARKAAAKLGKGDSLYLARALAIIARTTLDPQDIEAAREVALVTDEWEPIAMVAEALVMVRDFSTASGLISFLEKKQGFSDDFYRAWKELLKSTKTAEELEDIRQTILRDYCSNNPYRDRRLVKIAEAQAELASTPQGTNFVRATLNQITCVSSVSALLAIFKKTGNLVDLTDARRIAKGYEDLLLVAKATNNQADIERVRRLCLETIKNRPKNMYDLKVIMDFASVTKDPKYFELVQKEASKYPKWSRAVILAHLAEALNEAIQ